MVRVVITMAANARTVSNSAGTRRFTTDPANSSSDRPSSASSAAVSIATGGPASSSSNPNDPGSVDSDSSSGLQAMPLPSTSPAIRDDDSGRRQLVEIDERLVRRAVRRVDARTANGPGWRRRRPPARARPGAPTTASATSVRGSRASRVAGSAMSNAVVDAERRPGLDLDRRLRAAGCGRRTDAATWTTPAPTSAVAPSLGSRPTKQWCPLREIGTHQHFVTGESAGFGRRPGQLARRPGSTARP